MRSARSSAREGVCVSRNLCVFVGGGAGVLWDLEGLSISFSSGVLSRPVPPCLPASLLQGRFL